MIDLTPLATASLPIQVHVATVVPAFFIGAGQFLLPKGTPTHRAAGYIFMVLMLTTSVSAFFIESFMGSRFSWIHLFIPLTIFGVVRAWLAIRARKTFSHAAALLGVYFGAVCIAGYFAFKPGRIMHEVMFGG